MIVAFPLTNPQHTVYRVLIADHTTLFSWGGRVSAEGQVAEWAGPTDQSPEWLLYSGLAARYGENGN